MFLWEPAERAGAAQRDEEDERTCDERQYQVLRRKRRARARSDHRNAYLPPASRHRLWLREWHSASILGHGADGYEACRTRGNRPARLRVKAAGKALKPRPKLLVRFVGAGP